MFCWVVRCFIIIIIIIVVVVVFVVVAVAVAFTQGIQPTCGTYSGLENNVQ